MPVTIANIPARDISAPPPPEPPRLSEAAAGVLHDLRAALDDLIARAPGRPEKAVDLERALGVSKKLAWQVFRIVRSEDLSEIANIPSPASARTLLAAARKHGVPARLRDRAAAAFARFDRFAADQADDRAGLVTLLSGAAAPARDSYEINIRKAAFRANAHIWGAKVELMARTVIHHAKPRPLRSEDVALIIGDIGLQRLREGEPLGMVRYLRTGDTPRHHADHPIPTDRPEGPHPVDHGVGLLHEFCTHPLPRIVQKESVLGGFETELVMPAGRSGAATIFSEQFRENAETVPHPYYDVRLFITIPVETAVCDLLVPAGASDPGSARVAVYGRRPHPEHVFDERKADLLPQRESAIYLGTLDQPPAITGSGRHAEAVRYVLHHRGWLGSRYDVYRCRLQYPVLHTLVCLRADATTR
ncbi:MAG: hypothetical protein WD749_13815 [Phycisphaerales bacterium]